MTPAGLWLHTVSERREHTGWLGLLGQTSAATLREGCRSLDGRNWFLSLNHLELLLGRGWCEGPESLEVKQV